MATILKTWDIFLDIVPDFSGILKVIKVYWFELYENMYWWNEYWIEPEVHTYVQVKYLAEPEVL